MNAGRFIPNLLCAMKISEDDTSLGLPPAFLHVACEKMGGPWWIMVDLSLDLPERWANGPTWPAGRLWSVCIGIHDV